jgi:tetratricopeptide (TPR) repeat protein
MKNYFIKPILLLLISFVVLSCTSKSEKQITNKEDYQSYLIEKENESLKKVKNEIDFWQKKYDAAPNQYTYLITLASLYSQKFEITGNIEDLYLAEKLLVDCNQRVKGEKAGIHRAIAKNYISQHRFKEALEHLNKAFALGENKLATEKMLFDVQMELGNYEEAKAKLTTILDFKDFDYLIRAAKWNDHIGDLDAAIQLMEVAKTKAESSKNVGLKVWIYSNIADFYGHAGRIQDAYNYYLKTLEMDANNMYALKGIAWIVFSHERNPQDALQIVDYIATQHSVPDLFLLKADIYEFSGNLAEKRNAINEYYASLEKNNYGDMYNKYNALLYAEIPGETNKSIVIAKKEIENRPTPESYDLLAWAYYNNGDFDKALEIIEKYTIGKSHEPLIVFHNETILKANNKLTKENSNKNDLVVSIYELGPNLETSIKKL